MLTKLAAAVCNVMRLRRFAAASARTPHSVVGYAHHSINVVLVVRLRVAAGTKLCNPISTSPLLSQRTRNSFHFRAQHWFSDFVLNVVCNYSSGSQIVLFVQNQTICLFHG